MMHENSQINLRLHISHTIIHSHHPSRAVHEPQRIFNSMHCTIFGWGPLNLRVELSRILEYSRVLESKNYWSIFYYSNTRQFLLSGNKPLCFYQTCCLLAPNRLANQVQTRHTHLQSTAHWSPAIPCRPYTASHNSKVHAFIFLSATFRSTS